MSWRTFRALGLLLLLALVALHFAFGQSIGAKSEQQWTDWLLQGSGAMLALAVVAFLLEKAGVKVSGARCTDCRKRIPHGKTLCHDHLMSRTMAAREKYHGERGLGI